jgi:putative DNA primase/helicase
MAKPSLRLAASAGTNETEVDFTGDKTLLPYGFRYTKDGSIERFSDGGKDDADNRQKWTFLCSPIEFLAETENADGKMPGVLVRIRTQSGRWHKLALSRSSIVGGEELARALIDHGLRIDPGSRGIAAFKRLLMYVRPEKQARCVERVGWHENTFVLPDEIIGQPADMEIVFQPPYPINHAYRSAGTFEDWKDEVAVPSLGNSRLEFAICDSLTGPLLKSVNMDGGGFHFRGPSTSGKSTALHVAGSMWGGGGVNGFVRSWRATDNALEGMALLHNDTFLGLDEMAEVEARAAFNTAYMLSNGQGKARSNKAGDLRQSHEWRCSFLSTGEIGLGAKIAEDGKKATAGQEVRVIDIPADAGRGMGLFEDLHNFARPGDLADALRSATKRHYGHGARAFITEFVKDLPGVTAEIRDLIDGFVAKVCPEKAAGQVRRVARRFALVACAGELAISFGVLPWPRFTAHNAAKRCFDDWLRSRGGAGQKEDNDAYETVMGFVSRYGSRFRPWTAPDALINDCAGFVRETDEGRTFYVFRSTFQNEICAKGGIDHEHAADVLAARGLLTKSADGKRTRPERLPKAGHQRVYVLTMAGENTE